MPMTEPQPNWSGGLPDHGPPDPTIPLDSDGPVYAFFVTTVRVEVDARSEDVTEVLVDEVRPPRSHDHGDEANARPRVAGRNREGKLVHLDGGPELLGRLVVVEVGRAGPYALSGRLVAGTA